MKKRLFFLLLVCLCTVTAMAQRVTVSGTVIDGLEKEPMPSSSVQLLHPKDSSQVVAVATTANGKFTLPSVRTGNYILKISFVGYKTLFKNLNLTKDEKKVDLGTLVLEDNAKLMREAVATAQLAQVEVKGDTFQYNADAYKLPEGSSLEELVRKIPGAELDADGNIKINGKTVSRILMKGKEFFGDDKDMALKNLPAKMIDKIKAYDKKSDYSRMTGIDDGNEETVLDLTPKRNMSDGWLINIDLAAGNARQDDLPGASADLKVDFPKPLYTGNINVNRFTDNLQLNIIASRNNINGGSGRWGGFSGGSGVTTTTMVGANVTWYNDKEQFTPGYFEVGGNARFNARESENSSLSASEMFTTKNFTNSSNWSKSTNKNFNADFRLMWMPDSFTSLTIRPSFTHSENKSQSRNKSFSFNQNPYDFTDNPLAADTAMANATFMYDDDDDPSTPQKDARVNFNDRKSYSMGTTNSGNASLQINRRLAKPGRNISLDLSGNFSHSDNDSYSLNDRKLYQESMGSANIKPFQYTFTPSPSKSWNAQGRVSYTEPLNDYLNLQASYQYQRRFTDNDRTTFNLEELVGELMEDGNTMLTEALLREIYENGNGTDHLLDNLLQQKGYLGDWRSLTQDVRNSQYATYKENNHNANLLLRYTNIFENEQELRMTAGVTFQPQNTHMDYKKNDLDTTVTRTTYNIAPRLDARWKISNVSQLRIRYNARMSQPSMTNLMEVTDDRDQLNINTGNAGLRSSWSNNIGMDYNGYLMDTQTSWNINANYSNTRNSISTARIFDPTTGGNYSRPENIDGNWNASFGTYFNTALGYKKYWNFSNNLSVNYNYRKEYLNTEIGVIRDAAGRVDMDATFHQKGVLKDAASKSTGVNENIRLNYRYTFYDDRWSLDFGANAGFNYNHTRSAQKNANNVDNWTYNYGGNATIMMPWSVTFNTTITQQSRRGYGDKSMNTNETLWNLTAQKSFLKGNAATISVEWNDILHQRSNVSRMISAIQRNDTFSNNINSYFMVHFIYRLNLLGDKEARNMMRGFGGGRGGRGGGFGGGGFGGGGFGGGMGGFGGGRF